MALNVLFENYNIKTADDLQSASKDLIGDSFKKVLKFKYFNSGIQDS